MIDVHVFREEGLIIVEPSGPLEKSDFQKLADTIDTSSEDKGRLTGLIIHTKAFPGWEDFGAFLKHMNFVKAHHKKIQRVAIVTDAKIGDVGPSIAKHFVSAELKHFAYERFDEARQWALEAI